MERILIKYNDTVKYSDIVRKVKTSWDYKGKDDSGEPIYSHDTPYPTLTFKGTVKVHGTNAGIVKHSGNEDFIFQSRENVLSLMADNAGFFQTMAKHTNTLNEIFTTLVNTLNVSTYNSIVVYGEWAGKGVQKGVAISEIDQKVFLVFAVKVNGEFISMDNIPTEIFTKPEIGIYDIRSFGEYEVVIDFNNPESVVDYIDELTKNVEKECPVGKGFGVSGVGEGIVWECFNNFLEERLFFKSKGDKHKVSKNSNGKSVSATTDINKDVAEFVEMKCTEGRLEQGYELIKSVNGGKVTHSDIPKFIEWVVSDTFKEESETVIQSGLDPKVVKKELSNKARKYILDKINAI